MVMIKHNIVTKHYSQIKIRLYSIYISQEVMRKASLRSVRSVKSVKSINPENNEGPQTAKVYSMY